MKRPDSYFLKAFFTILLSVVAFWVLKEFLPKRLFAETNVKTDNMVVDSLMLEAMASHFPADTIMEKDTMAKEEMEEKFHSPLARFFERLYTIEKTKKGSVRIAYFGDSMTEGDLIVQDIRKNFQEKYGGKGVGFVPISLAIPSTSISIRHEFSDNWELYSFLTKSPIPVGISGYVSFVPDSATSWVKFREGSSPLIQPVLFFGQSDNHHATIQVISNKDSLESVTLHPDKKLNTITLPIAGNTLTIDFFDADSIPFYGVDFADKDGVHVDNFSARGNSGLPLSTFNVSLMQEFQHKLHYDLIVLQYGTNVVSSKSTEYSWYGKRMKNTVEHIKRCFPEADILVISLADKAAKYGTEMKTDTVLPFLIQVQKNYAKNTGSAFINLFELMGGEGTMVDWANQEPPLAAKDYTHFSVRGSKKIADFIFREIEKEYKDFKEQNDLDKSEAKVEVLEE